MKFCEIAVELTLSLQVYRSYFDHCKMFWEMAFPIEELNVSRKSGVCLILLKSRNGYVKIEYLETDVYEYLHALSDENAAVFASAPILFG